MTDNIILQKQQKFLKFYTYIYLDIRKPGKFNYNGLPLSFLYEPFYVGEGKDNRLFQHLKESYEYRDTNKIKCRIIRKIKSQCKKDPIIFKIREFKTYQAAFTFEQYLIKKIGRRIDKSGPLSNIALGGRSPMYNRKHSESSKKKFKILNSRLRNKIQTPKEDLIELIKKDKKLIEIAKYYGINSCTLKNRLKKYFNCSYADLRQQFGLSREKNNFELYGNGIIIDKKELIELIKKDLNTIEISKYFKISGSCLNDRIKSMFGLNFGELRQKLNMPKYTTSGIKNPRYINIQTPPEEILNLIKQNKTLKFIANYYGLKIQTLRLRLKKQFNKTYSQLKL